MITITLTPAELQTVIHALRTAKDVFDEDTIRTKDNPRLSEQFARQADDAIVLAMRLEDL